MSDLKDFVIENGFLTRYVGESKDIIIPGGVTGIGECAFAYGFINYNAITIPDSVTIIADSALCNYGSFSSICVDSNNPVFSSIDGILFKKTNILRYPPKKVDKSYIIPDRITSIAKDAFSYCRNLTTITIPDGVTSIGDYAFRNCINLTSITIPDSVTSIGYKILKGCNNIKEIILLSNAETFDGSNLEEIWNYFLKTELKLVLMYSCLKHIPELIINSTNASRKIKANKNKIYDLAVEEDNAEVIATLFNLFKIIKLEELNEYIEKANGTVAVKAFLLDYKTMHYSVEKQEKHETDRFEKKLGIKELSTTDLKKIWAYKVLEDDTLELTKYKGDSTEIYIPERIGKKKVTRLTDGLFSPEKIVNDVSRQNALRSITSVSIPNSVTSIGNGAFSGCEGLQDNKGFVVVHDVLYSYHGSDTEITIPDNVTLIEGWAFSGCTSLTSITIPGSVISIKECAFIGCKNLTSVTIPEGVTSIEEDTFRGCINLTSITIPDSVISIKEWAFGGCTNLTNITLPDSVTSFGCGAFEDCENLTSFTIPEGVTSIEGNTFRGCTNLTNVIIPDSVTEIGSEAFSYCSSLKSITIPESVISIGKWAFSGCTNLINITIPNSVTTIGAAAFSYCSSLKSITIPDGVTSIGFWAFSGCDNLTIHASADSYAEQYAKENNINFIAEE